MINFNSDKLFVIFVTLLKCYFLVYFKLIKLYEQTYNFKNNRKLKNSAIFKNSQILVEF